MNCALVAVRLFAGGDECYVVVREFGVVGISHLYADAVHFSNFLLEVADFEVAANSEFSACFAFCSDRCESCIVIGEGAAACCTLVDTECRAEVLLKLSLRVLTFIRPSNLNSAIVVLILVV